MARSLNGAGDLINFGSSSILNPAAITISCWLNPSSLANAYSAVVSRVIATDGYQIFIKSTGKLAMYVNINNALKFYDPGSTTLSTGTWYHVAMTYVAGALSGYVNGALDGSFSPVDSLGMRSFSANCEIGNDTNTAGRLLGGSVADCAIWNVALTTGEIKGLAFGVRPYLVRSNAILGYWPLDGLASPEPDFSGNALNGALTGTSLVNGPPVTLFTPKSRAAPLIQQQAGGVKNFPPFQRWAA